MYLSIVAPAWNEADGIEHFLEAALEHADLLEASPQSDVKRVEVVIVDDCSQDSTASLVHAASNRDDRVVLLQHSRNRGLGAAVRSGIDGARGDVILYTDADLPVDFTEISAMVDEYVTSGVSLVSARRAGHGGDGVRRWFYRHIYDGLIRVVLGVPVSDVNFAFKLFDADVVRSLGLRGEGSIFDAELLGRLHRSGTKWSQIRVPYKRRQFGESSLATPRVIVGILRDLRSLAPEIRAIGRDSRSRSAATVNISE
ncbi:MAG: glycosyltransferase family 2 protein [Microthrixaceae bacterium]